VIIEQQFPLVRACCSHPVSILGLS